MTILDRIMEIKKEEVKQLHQKYSYSRFSESSLFHADTLDLREAMNLTDDIAVIAEIKKASPSRGLIRENFDHLEIASDYINGNTEAISVLTDKNFFDGDISYLKEIAINKQVPLLRKDFLIDEFQILQARASGADAVLLIAEILDKTKIEDLTQTAYDLGMEVLLELHSIRELEKIDFDLNRLIGINNRNLEDFSVDLQTSVRLSRVIPPEITVIAESGIHDKNDLDVIKKTRIAGILVGEHLMKSEDIGSALNELKGWCSRAR